MFGSQPPPIKPWSVCVRGRLSGYETASWQNGWVDIRKWQNWHTLNSLSVTHATRQAVPTRSRAAALFLRSVQGQKKHTRADKTRIQKPRGTSTTSPDTHRFVRKHFLFCEIFPSMCRRLRECRLSYFWHFLSTERQTSCVWNIPTIQHLTGRWKTPSLSNKRLSPQPVFHLAFRPG